MERRGWRSGSQQLSPAGWIARIARQPCLIRPDSHKITRARSEGSVHGSNGPAAGAICRPEPRIGSQPIWLNRLSASRIRCRSPSNCRRQLPARQDSKRLSNEIILVRVDHRHLQRHAPASAPDIQRPSVIAHVDGVGDSVTRSLQGRLQGLGDISPAKHLHAVVSAIDCVVRETGAEKNLRAKRHQPVSSSSGIYLSGRLFPDLMGRAGAGPAFRPASRRRATSKEPALYRSIPGKTEATGVRRWRSDSRSAIM